MLRYPINLQITDMYHETGIFKSNIGNKLCLEWQLCG